MKLQNVSNQSLDIPGVGIVEAGQIIDAPVGFHNINFKKVVEIKKPEPKKDKAEVE